jgi:hypothetical protein
MIRCSERAVPSAPRQCVILKLKGIKETEAKKLVVEVVFKVEPGCLPNCPRKMMESS